MTAGRWTDAEDALIRAHYIAGGVLAVQAHLPHRGIAGIRHRARVIGVLRARRWTAADDAQLRELWTGRLTVPEVAKKLGRSPTAAHERAQDIGLPIGVLPGWEALTHACERTGYDWDQMRAILANAGVQLRPCMTVSSLQARCRYAMVLPTDVDAAVRVWLEREPVKRVAARLGVNAAELRSRLRAAGVQPPPHRKCWRVTEAEALAAFHVKATRAA